MTELNKKNFILKKFIKKIYATFREEQCRVNLKFKTHVGVSGAISIQVRI